MRLHQKTKSVLAAAAKLGGRTLPTAAMLLLVYCAGCSKSPDTAPAPPPQLTGVTQQGQSQQQAQQQQDASLRAASQKPPK